MSTNPRELTTSTEGGAGLGDVLPAEEMPRVTDGVGVSASEPGR